MKRNTGKARIPLTWPERDIRVTGGAPGEPENMAEAVAFLLSDTARHISTSIRPCVTKTEVAQPLTQALQLKPQLGRVPGIEGRERLVDEEDSGKAPSTSPTPPTSAPDLEAAATKAGVFAWAQTSTREARSSSVR